MEAEKCNGVASSGTGRRRPTDTLFLIVGASDVPGSGFQVF